MVSDDLGYHLSRHTSSMKKPLPIKQIVGVALVVVSVVLFLVIVDVQAVAAEIRRADWRYLLAASAALLAGMVTHAGRWRAIFKERPPLLATFHAANAGHLLNIAIPLRAGEAARVVALSRSQARPAAEVASTVVVERLFEPILRLAALGGAAVFGLGIQPSPLSVLGGVAFLVFAFVALAWVVAHPDKVLQRGAPLLGRLPRLNEEKARKVLERLLSGLSSLSSWRQVALIMLWSIGTWAIFWLFHTVVLWALPPLFPESQRLAITLGTLALAPPTAPTQPGIYHASLVVPLGVIGLDETRLTTYAVVLHGVQSAWMIALGLVGFLATRKQKEFRPLPGDRVW
jgi:uncharacterized protein (TIRG00374 family)